MKYIVIPQTTRTTLIVKQCDFSYSFRLCESSGHVFIHYPLIDWHWDPGQMRSVLNAAAITTTAPEATSATKTPMDVKTTSEYQRKSRVQWH